MEKMEHERGYENKIPYVERRVSGVLELMAYAGRIKINKTIFAGIQRCLIIPLPPDFDFSGVDVTKGKEPNSIIITEDKIIPESRLSKKRWDAIYRLRKEPGYLSVRTTIIKGDKPFGPRSKFWISKEIYKEISKRSLYVDKYYAMKIFGEKLYFGETRIIF